ncbi:hypothetical protein XAP412_1100055 [Xanthomonas phaseoli pv. phaseoli]|uniref:Uncharacterized protein n=1 Tax=Xanthomonas campestris pv. phaseoli TaxID=317013 RepID=A0AB38DUU5_XANCH|nr:hypothetical protein XAP412_1100055 [Xanthomonas phaseoli pv. phaseoli]SON76299.1 hypothetical protein XAP6984_1150055 [Xanthomonas phaseoli pv. phaseoli]SON80302.1 hypothetical protein XAP7430_1120055 [Xanthomonas phaseoli pv. phaseoli]SOO30816.1 hypothetical protein XAP6164_4800002 [Xanthomonas phaseoli pv. phaseoli]
MNDVRRLKPLSPWGEKAQLARHRRACLGAPATLARAGARSGGWGEGAVSRFVPSMRLSDTDFGSRRQRGRASALRRGRHPV